MASTPESTDLLDSAQAAGLVAAREVAAGAVDVRGAAVLLHGRAIAYATLSETAERELTCLRLLAETELVPEVLRGPEARRGIAGRVIWTEAIRGARLSELTGTMAELAEVCQAWGTALATLHLAPAASAAEPPMAGRPWVLDPDRLPRSMRQAPAGSARAYVLRTLLSDRGLLRTAARLADRWTADHWTHGDLTADRVLVQHRPDLRVRFVDLQVAGLGDPAWDLAGALDTVDELTAGPRTPWRTASGSCLRDYLLQGYRRTGGTAVADTGARALRIVARAWESAAALDARAGHPASMHPAVGQAAEASRLTERLAQARELAARSARPGLVAA